MLVEVLAAMYDRFEFLGIIAGAFVLCCNHVFVHCFPFLLAVDACLCAPTPPSCLHHVILVQYVCGLVSISTDLSV